MLMLTQLLIAVRKIMISFRKSPAVSKNIPRNSPKLNPVCGKTEIAADGVVLFALRKFA